MPRNFFFYTPRTAKILYTQERTNLGGRTDSLLAATNFFRVVRLLIIDGEGLFQGIIFPLDETKVLLHDRMTIRRLTRGSLPLSHRFLLSHQTEVSSGLSANKRSSMRINRVFPNCREFDTTD